MEKRCDHKFSNAFLPMLGNATTIAEMMPKSPTKKFRKGKGGRRRKLQVSDRISFHIGDAQDLHFADATFDASLSLLVFNFIPDPAKALQEIRRVTQPEGSVSAAVWDYGERMRMLRVFWDSAVEVDPRAEKFDEKHMPLCRAGELSQLW